MTSSSDKRMVIASLKSKLLSFKMIINSLGLEIITGSSAYAISDVFGLK